MEINYNESTKMHLGYPKIKKLGIVSMNGESTPFVWNGKLMRLELEDASMGTDLGFKTHAIVRERESGKVISRFGEGCYYYSFYMENDTAYVIGTKSNVGKHSGSTFLVYESKDLINWSCRELLSRPGWAYCNTSLTKGDDEYVLLMEAAEPSEVLGIPYTFFFAKSKDMINWTFMDNDHCLSRERYNGGPYMRYSNGWYYIFSVTQLPLYHYTNYVYRTKDFETYEIAPYNPILMPDNDDKIISPYACDLDEEKLERIRTGFNINNSDIDMCDYNGKTIITYNIGNQLGFYALCEAEYDGTVDEFLAACFDETL